MSYQSNAHAMLFAVPNIIVTLEKGRVKSSKGIFSDAKIRQHLLSSLLKDTKICVYKSNMPRPRLQSSPFQSLSQPANDAREATGVMRGRAGLEKREGREKKARPCMTPVASRASFAGWEREKYALQSR